MNTITIPKNLIKNDDLVILPRKEYEKVLRLARKKYTQLDRDIDESIVEYKAGKFFGPFVSVKEFKKSLEK